MKFPDRAVILVAVATAFSLLGDSFLYAVLPAHFTGLGLLPVHVGILLSVNRWVRLITNTLAERAYRRWDSRLLLAGALAVGAATTASYGLVTSFPLLLIARMTWGLCWSLIRQAGMVTAAETSPSGAIGQTMGFLNGISRTGSLVGVLAGGFLHDQFGFINATIVFGIVSVCAIVPGYLSRARLPRIMHTSEHTSLSPQHIGLFIVTALISMVGVGIMFSTFGLMLKVRAGATLDFNGWHMGIATATGLVLGCRWITDSLGAPVLGHLGDRFGRRTASLVFLALGSIALVLAASNDSVMALILSTLAFFVCATTLQVMVAAEAGSRGPGAVATYATAWDTGSAAGPLAGWIMLQAGMETDAVLVLGAALYAVALIAARWAFPRSS